MGKPAAVNAFFRGLVTSPNQLTAVEGSLVEAENVVLNLDNLVESRRGLNTYGIAAAQNFTSIFSFKDKLLAHSKADGLLYRDSDDAGTWVAYSGVYFPELGNRVKSGQSNKNFYFSTVDGVRKLDTLTDTPVLAGTPRALDLDLTLVAGSILADDEAVAYRIVWGITDANANLVLGTPSQRVSIFNEAGGARDVQLNFTIPDGITTAHIYQVYRSLAVPVTSVGGPSDELQMSFQSSPTAAEITAGVITVTDTIIEEILGADIYTNSSQEGIAQVNDEPPLCTDMELYQGRMFFANTEVKHTAIANLLAVGSPNGIQVNDTFSISNEDDNEITNGTFTTDSVWTKGNGWTISGGEAHKAVSASAGRVSQDGVLVVGETYKVTFTITAHVGGSFRAFCGTTGGTFRSSIGTFVEDITCAGNTTFAIEGGPAADGSIDDVIVSAGGVGGITITGAVAEDAALGDFLVSTLVNIADAIEETALSMVRVINRMPNNGVYYAYYTSGVEDPPGQITVVKRAFQPQPFFLLSNRGAAFSPELGSTIAENISTPSKSLKAPNRIMFSKLGRPEAVPGSNFIDLGSADKAIERILALKEAVFALKQDGVFMITGDSPANFRPRALDTTTFIRGRETAVVASNRILMFSNQGVVAITENSITVVSREIEDQVLQYNSEGFTDFDDKALGVAYDSDRRYILAVPSDITKATADISFVYNTFTQAWTKWLGNLTAMAVGVRDDKLYTATTDAMLKRERKAFTNDDFTDDEFAVNITGSSGTTVNMTSTADVVVKQTLKQGALEAIVTAVVNATTITVDITQSWLTGAATVFNPIPCRIKWKLEPGAGPGGVKQFNDVMFYFQEAMFKELVAGFSTNSLPTEETVTLSGAEDGEGLEVRTLVPLAAARGLWLHISLGIEQAFARIAAMGYGVKYRGVSEKF